MRRLLTGRAAPAIATAVTMLLVAGGGYALAAGGGGKKVKACVAQGSRTLYVSPCKKGDKKLALGTKGPRGKQGKKGATGAAGPAGPTGPTGVVTFGSWAGMTETIPTTSGFVFAGVTTTLTTAASQTIIASSESALGTSAGTASANISICKAPSTTGTPVTLLDPLASGAFSNVTVTTTRATYAAEGTGAPGVGTWKIGECVNNTSTTQTINENDYTIGHAFVVNGTAAPGSTSAVASTH
jgi:hypothetical protein